MPRFTNLFFLFFAFSIVAPVMAQEEDSLKSTLKYGSKGFEFRTVNNDFLMHLEWRIQTRFATPYENDPISLEDLNVDNTYLGINRARMKVGGHAYKENFQYYLEYELFAGLLLDYRVMYKVSPWLNFKIGQWKAQYSRERIISSGKQQLVDRSILNYAFTLDRQQGASLFGRVKGRGALDFNYWVSSFMGTGRGANANDDKSMLWMGRWQWNPFGESVGFQGSDIERHNKLIMSLTLAGATNKSPYTRFSTAGGGQLPGFEEGVASQYHINQWMFETAGMVKGFSWHQEYHRKKINDVENNMVTIMEGNFIQMGYFLSEAINRFPKRLELFARYGVYSSDIDALDNFRHEITTGVNWFLNNHRNKLSFEYSFLEFQDQPDELQDGSRVRLQWEISF